MLNVSGDVWVVNPISRLLEPFSERNVALAQFLGPLECPMSDGSDPIVCFGFFADDLKQGGIFFQEWTGVGGHFFHPFSGFQSSHQLTTTFVSIFFPTSKQTTSLSPTKNAKPPFANSILPGWGFKVQPPEGEIFVCEGFEGMSLKDWGKVIFFSTIWGKGLQTKPPIKKGRQVWGCALFWGWCCCCCCCCEKLLTCVIWWVSRCWLEVVEAWGWSFWEKKPCAKDRWTLKSSW